MSEFFLGTLVVLVIVFFLTRELNNWYWKINQRIALIEKQTILLEKLVELHGGTNEIEIEDTRTGEKRLMGIDAWLTYKKNNPEDKFFKVIK